MHSCFANEQGQPTCNLKEQFRAVRTAWRGVTELFCNGEPNHDTFFEQYGQHIDALPITLPPLTADILRDEFLKIKQSSPGLDGWCHIDFKLLAHCAPWTIDVLCELLLVVEECGKWPDSVISGFTTLIPKSAEPPKHPTGLLPLTVLSVVYRAWARIRARQLNEHWQELFAHKGMWGGRTARGAEPLLIDVALDLEASAPGAFTAGLSFDLSKAFDRVPRELLARILDKTCMRTMVYKPYISMLRNVTRRFKIGTAFDAPQKLWGGVLQGCPLAMLSMNVICNIWLRTLDDQVANCNPRSYVDDVSATLVKQTRDQLVEDTGRVYQISSNFVSATGGQINSSKCFTFADSAVASAIHPGIAHCKQFRLVGGSFVCNAVQTMSVRASWKNSG